jgi:DNA-binding CsgD family transcriptional regulator
VDSKKQLSPALLEILELSAKHCTSSKVLAALLFKSPRTIDKQWEQILDYFGVKRRHLAMEEAREQRII